MSGIHPPDDQLRDYLADLLSEPEDERIGQHLSDCRACQRKAEQLVGSTFPKGTDDTTSLAPDPSRTMLDDKTALPDFGTRFVTMEELAQGGMGIVFKVFDRDFQRRCCHQSFQIEKRCGDISAF